MFTDSRMSMLETWGECRRTFVGGNPTRGPPCRLRQGVTSLQSRCHTHFCKWMPSPPCWRLFSPTSHGCGIHTPCRSQLAPGPPVFFLVGGGGSRFFGFEHILELAIYSLQVSANTSQLSALALFLEPTRVRVKRRRVRCTT